MALAGGDEPDTVEEVPVEGPPVKARRFIERPGGGSPEAASPLVERRRREH